MNSDLTKNDDQKIEDFVKSDHRSEVFLLKYYSEKVRKNHVRKHLWQIPFLVKFVSDSLCAKLFQKDSIASAFL